MEIAIDKKEQNYGLITVNVVAADYDEAVKQQLNEFRKKANLKGFRPGKVPFNFIKRMYGKEVKADVLMKTVNENLFKYIDEKEKVLFIPIQKSDSLTPDEIESRDEFSFEFEVCTLPEFTYKLDSNISMERPVLQPSDEDVTETIGRIQEQLPEDKEVEAVEKGDFISGTFKQVGKDFESYAMLPTNQLSEEGLKEFEGKKVGETVTFDITKALPEENQIKNLFTPEEEVLPTLTGDFEVEIEKITRKSTPELNQEFFDKAVGPDKVNGEEEFRAEIRTQIEQANQGYANSIFESEIREKLLEMIDIELPEDLIKKVMQINREEPLSEEEIEKQLPNFLRSAKWQAIVTRIAKDANIEVTPDEVREVAKNKVRAQFAQMGIAGLPEEQMEPIIESVLSREEGKKTLEEAQHEAFDSKVYGHIIENIQVTDKAYTAKEFEAYVEELNKKAEEEAKAEETEA